MAQCPDNNGQQWHSNYKMKSKQCAIAEINCNSLNVHSDNSNDIHAKHFSELLTSFCLTQHIDSSTQNKGGIIFITSYTYLSHTWHTVIYFGLRPGKQINWTICLQLKKCFVVSSPSHIFRYTKTRRFKSCTS